MTYISHFVISIHGANFDQTWYIFSHNILWDPSVTSKLTTFQFTFKPLTNPKSNRPPEQRGDASELGLKHVTSSYILNTTQRPILVSSLALWSVGSLQLNPSLAKIIFSSKYVLLLKPPSFLHSDSIFLIVLSQQHLMIWELAQVVMDNQN